MITHAFDHCTGTRISDAESLCCNPSEVGLSAGSAVERDVAKEDVVLSLETAAFGGVDNDLPSR